MNFRLIVSAALLAALSAPLAALEPSPAAAGAEVYFITPTAGARVPGTFTVRFGLKGMGVAPAGVAVDGTGHHHLLINADPMPDLSQPLPSTEQVRHFGKGQTETELELAPGKYTLQLVLGNHLHVPHQPPVISGTIEVIVE